MGRAGLSADVRAVQRLLAAVFDYAGLFPPAALELPDAVGRYAACRRGPRRWMLGRFVVPAARLEELQACLRDLPTPGEATGPWPLAAIAGADVTADLTAIHAFGERSEDEGTGTRAEVDVYELRSPQGLAQLGSAAVSPHGLQLACELPLQGDQHEAMSDLARRGVVAKARLGGLTPDAFPHVPDVAAWLVAAARARLAVKLTAGLHHAVRGAYRVTDEAASPRAMMHGVVNVLVAASILQAQARQPDEARVVEAVLGEQDASAFVLGDEEVGWRDVRAPLEAVERARSFLLAVGSCSFDEPAGELRALGLPIA